MKVLAYRQAGLSTKLWLLLVYFYSELKTTLHNKNFQYFRTLSERQKGRKDVFRCNDKNL